MIANPLYFISDKRAVKIEDLADTHTAVLVTDDRSHVLRTYERPIGFIINKLTTSGYHATEAANYARRCVRLQEPPEYYF